MVETTVKVTLPEMGESVTEGSIVEWRKKAGEWIDEGEVLVEVTTDKVDVEVPATVSGLVTALLAREGDTVAVGAPLAEIDPQAPKPSGVAAPVVAEQAPAAAPSPASAAIPTAVPTLLGKATSRALNFAKEHNLEIASVRGSGPNGLITRLDVIIAAAEGTAKPSRAGDRAPSAASPPLPPMARVTPIKGPNAALVEYMEQSLAIPTATSFRTFSVGILAEQRAALNASLKAARRGEKVSFTHLIAYAIARAVREMPELGVTFRREGGAPQRVEAGVNLGLAVDAERKDGSRFLVVPVIKNAGQLDFAAFHAAYDDLVVKARDGKLSADQLSGANITLTNPGGIGTVASVPRLLAGQGVILAAGAIAYPPGFGNAPQSALEQLGIEKVMTLTSTYDHRVIQGAQSGELLRRLEQLLGGADDFFDSIRVDLRLNGGRGSEVTLLGPGASATIVAAPQLTAAPSADFLRSVASGMAIVSAYRDHGHLGADLDPLGLHPVGDAALDLASYALAPATMEAIPASILGVKVPGETLAEVLPRLRETYSSTIAYEVEHISNHEQRSWLLNCIESGAHRTALSAEHAVRLLGRLTRIETMERYLRKTFIGFKTFSIEGLDVMIPMLEEIISLFADDEIETVVIGMAHRGRLGTIAHVVNQSYEEILAEFEAAETRGESDDDNVTGDVKYHHGAKGVYTTADGKRIAVQLASNPSHLEAVDSAVEGLTRALQTGHETNLATLDRKKAAAILIHGDAAFSGQGVVAEVLNLQGLAGYNIGGTVHIIANNQIGFTTDPLDDRSTRYASDLAKGFDLPIIHVNADDVEACIAATRLAIEFRRRFDHDVLIDLIGYRRFGHNETDEPVYTQPGMYEKIKTHPTVRELFARRLIAGGVLTDEKAGELQSAASRRISEAHAQVKSNTAAPKLITVRRPSNGELDTPIDTRVPKPLLDLLSEELITVEPGFTVHPKLAKQFERRKAAYAADGEVDWGLAEALSFASLLTEGTPIRLTGQDSERGTFSHRHLVLHDAKTERKYAPIQHLSSARASFEIHNSPLSEYACLGFEYGYAGAVPNALVIWEAQFGDFNNGAQIIIDQFIAAGQAKWGDTSRLTLLLPHGYEGQGPDHSSARLERFLQLSAEGNLRIANCTTAAQYFHLLRSQAKDPYALPLIILTPKSLLRSRPSYATLNQLSEQTFQHVIDDPNAQAKRESIDRIILCSGKVYYDLVSEEAYKRLRRTAVVRIELLAPFPFDKLLVLCSSYPKLKQITWVQEEPRNMGAFAHFVRRLGERPPVGVQVGYIGRPDRASPSGGYPGAHTGEQERIIAAALAE